jgi:hypothetical protein
VYITFKTRSEAQRRVMIEGLLLYYVTLIRALHPYRITVQSLRA